MRDDPFLPFGIHLPQRGTAGLVVRLEHEESGRRAESGGGSFAGTAVVSLHRGLPSSSTTLSLQHDAQMAACFLAKNVLPTFQQAGLRLKAVITDGGGEFKGSFDLRVRTARHKASPYAAAPPVDQRLRRTTRQTRIEQPSVNTQSELDILGDALGAAGPRSFDL